MRKPLIAKKKSTPMNPLCEIFGPGVPDVWCQITASTLSARKPSSAPNFFVARNDS